MGIRVMDFRVSFLWAEAPGTLLEDRSPAPFAFLGREASWNSRFSKVQAYAGDPDDLVPPWPKQKGRHFWMTYLGADPHEAPARRAWKHLVPLRLSKAFPLEAPWLSGRVSAEGFFYPFGHALVVGFRLYCGDRDPWRLSEVVKLAHALRKTSQFAVEVGGVKKDLGLIALADVGLTALRRTAYGTPGVLSATTPYSVVTIVRAEGVDPTTPVPDGGEIHRALEALTGWALDWETAKLPPLTQAAIDAAGSTSGHVHYSRPRGRCIWFPQVAAVSTGPQRTLSCYHRNQTFLALQVESVGALVLGTAARLRSGATVPVAWETAARNAAGLLGRLYGGDASTYRSRACRDHMDKNGIATELEYLRDFFGMDPLA